MFDLLILASLLGLGYYFGRRTENRHYKSLLTREEKYRSIAVTSGNWKSQITENQDGQIFGAGVVVGADYFKTFIAGLRSLFGGRMNTYESLLDRGRREATLRVLEKADKWGAEKVVNFRLETAIIGGSHGKQGLPCVEIYAYGTAIKENKVHAIQA